VKKWSARLLQESQVSEQIFVDGCWRVILHHARLCLILGDHYYSSCESINLVQTRSIIGGAVDTLFPQTYFDNPNLLRV
ncbi:hypothetical protein ACT453_41130, partial [Bacillus sp. D-CC]